MRRVSCLELEVFGARAPVCKAECLLRRHHALAHLLQGHLHLVPLVLPPHGLDLQVDVVIGKRVALLGKRVALRGKLEGNSGKARELIARPLNVGFHFVKHGHFPSHVRGVAGCGGRRAYL